MKVITGPAAAARVPDPAALPAEWAAWAEEPGRAVRIEEDGTPLGLVHAVMVSPTEAWLEGLWVHPAARGRGIGRRVVSEAEQLLAGYGAMTVRTAVPARDYAALAVAERSGFARACEAGVLLADIPSHPIEQPYEAPTRLATVRDASGILGVLMQSPDLRGWHGLVPLGWRFRRPLPELVRGLTRDRRVLLAGHESDAVAVFALRDHGAVITALTGPAAHRLSLMGAVAERARSSGARRLALFAPAPEPPAGFRAAWQPHPWCPDGLVVVERSLAAIGRTTH